MRIDAGFHGGSSAVLLLRPQVEADEGALDVRQVADDLADRVGQLAHQRRDGDDLVVLGEPRVREQVDRPRSRTAPAGAARRPSGGCGTRRATSASGRPYRGAAPTSPSACRCPACLPLVLISLSPCVKPSRLRRGVPPRPRDFLREPSPRSASCSRSTRGFLLERARIPRAAPRSAPRARRAGHRARAACAPPRAARRERRRARGLPARRASSPVSTPSGPDVDVEQVDAVRA